MKELSITADQVAANIAAELAKGDALDAIRTMMDGINRFEYDSAESLAPYLEQPRTTGNDRWDTLLAASIRYKAHQAGIRCLPSWTLKKPLLKFWWPIRISASKEYNDMAHTPAELLRVNIFMDERGFTTA